GGRPEGDGEGAGSLPGEGDRGADLRLAGEGAEAVDLEGLAGNPHLQRSALRLPVGPRRLQGVGQIAAAAGGAGLHAAGNAEGWGRRRLDPACDLFVVGEEAEGGDVVGELP